MSAAVPGTKVEIPTLPRPSGGNSLGYGEHFEFDQAMGLARFEVPIDLPESRELTPSLILRYTSGGANGIVGIGFSLEAAAISCRTSLGIPRYDGNDTFITETGDVLVARDPNSSWP